MMDDEILTIEQAAEILKMAPKQVYELCRRRNQERMDIPFPAFNLHRKAKRVMKSALVTWVSQMAASGRAQ
jgi:hypothetical protein